MPDYSGLIKSKLQQQLSDTGEFKGYFEVDITTQRHYDQVKNGWLGALSIFTSLGYDFQLHDLVLVLFGYKKRGWIIVTDQGLHFVKAKVRKRANEVHIEYKEHMSFPFAELSYINAKDQMTEVDLAFNHLGERYIAKLDNRFFIYRQLLPFLNEVVHKTSSTSE